ncbi:MAG TPA: hypothetical protein VGV15_04360, partial [Terriglobales bacterium]|nr:hypothetical protein [Terriglobales bacterium]
STQELQPAASIQALGGKSTEAVDPGDSAPITPEASSIGTIFRFLLAVLVIAAMIYIFLHRR